MLNIVRKKRKNAPKNIFKKVDFPLEFYLYHGCRGNIGHVLFVWIVNQFFLLNCASKLTDSTSAFPTGRRNKPPPPPVKDFIFVLFHISIYLLFSSVADPGCLYWIPDPSFSIPDPGSKRSRIRILTIDYKYFNQ